MDCFQPPQLCRCRKNDRLLPDESDILFFDFFLPGAADGKLLTVIEYQRAVSQTVNVFQVYKDAEMAAAKPFSIQTGEQVGKVPIDIQRRSALQMDGRLMAGRFCIEDISGIDSPPAAIHQKINLFRVVIFL